MRSFLTKKPKDLNVAEGDGMAEDSPGSDVDLDLVITQPVTRV